MGRVMMAKFAPPGMWKNWSGRSARQMPALVLSFNPEFGSNTNGRPSAWLLVLERIEKLPESGLAYLEGRSVPLSVQLELGARLGQPHAVFYGSEH
jgi:hypothetical protein